MDKKQKSLMPVALETLIILWLAWLTACQKEPIPEPTPTPGSTPTDTVTPVIPGDTITPTPGDTIVPIPPTPGDTINPTPWDTIVPGSDTIVPTPPTGGKVVNFYYDGGENFPPLDSIRRYADNPMYDSVCIVWSICSDYNWTPIGFNYACKKLKERFDLSPKVFGKSFILPYQILPDADSTNIGVKGMIQSNKDQYERWHYEVRPIVGDKHAKAVTKPNYYNGNRVLKSGRSH